MGAIRNCAKAVLVIGAVAVVVPVMVVAVAVGSHLARDETRDAVPPPQPASLDNM